MLLGRRPQPTFAGMAFPSQCWGGVPGRPCRDGIPGCCWSDVPGRTCWDGAPGRCWGGAPSRTCWAGVLSHGSPSVCSSQSDCDRLIPDDFVTVPDVVVFLENSELGDPTVVIPPIVRDGMSVDKGRHWDENLGALEGRLESTGVAEGQ